MKINLSPFDINTGGKGMKDIIPFANWVVQSISTLTRLFRNNITLEDNINGTKVQVTLSHGVQSVINIGGGSVYGVTVMRVRKTGEAIQSLEWGFTTTGGIYVIPEFKNSGTSVVVDLFVWRD